MIVDTHVHIWEIDPPRYPVGPTAPGWKSEPDEPATADELIADMTPTGLTIRSSCRPAGRPGTMAIWPIRRCAIPSG